MSNLNQVGFNPTVEGDETLTCYRHPKVETALRCYQCQRPICPKCARRSAVGYLCDDCLRGRKQRYEQGKPMDNVIAGGISLALGVATGWLSLMFFMVMIFLSPLAGGLIAEVVWRAVGRRYNSRLWWIVTAGIVLGTLPYLFLGFLITGIQVGAGDIPVGAFRLIGPIAHIFLASGMAIARLRLR